MPDPAPQPRAGLMAPYDHPYREFVPLVWKDEHVDRTLAIAAAVTAAGGAVSLATGSAGWVAAAAVLLVIALAIAAYRTAEAAIVVRRLTGEWDRSAELETVRAQRPHAGDADADVAHAEYAVTAEDTGFLFVWRFAPLAVFEDVPPGAVLVPGRPRHAATVVEERPLDPDAARAAEHLVEAQARAADLERDAAAAGRRALADAAQRAEIARETSSTAAALQHITGQRRPR